MKTFISSFCFIAITISIFSQTTKSINFNAFYSKECKNCRDIIANMPPEVQFGFQIDEQKNIYFTISNKNWLDKLFTSPYDGIAVDIVKKKRYDCSVKTLDRSSVVRGELFDPIYYSDLKKTAIPSDEGYLASIIGKLPDKYKASDIELNLFILINNKLCYFNNFYNLNSYRWDLLETGLYLDSIDSGNDYKHDEFGKYVYKNKTLKFNIPFERNKSVYSPKDIQPLYDSLKLTNYHIKKIKILAYASAEGSTERNSILQKQRANGIVNALSKFQNTKIPTEIKTAENWVELLNDLKGNTSFDFTGLSKSEIKNKLKKTEVLIQLEPILKNHRKAIVELELQKKDKFYKTKTEDLIKEFNSSVTTNHIKKALTIQNSLFERIKSTEIPASTINKLVIPHKRQYALLLTKNVCFKYLMNQEEFMNTYAELIKLEKIAPSSKRIKYNICALGLTMWQIAQDEFPKDVLKERIYSLKKIGIPQKNVNRMLINYHILNCEFSMKKGEYEVKDKSLSFIKSKYKTILLSDEDCLSLSQYFTSYAKYEWALELLEPKVNSIAINEDLLFYYLNLTLIDPTQISDDDYRIILLNAINQNKDRFCKIFNSLYDGGVTFQLLEDDYLRATYCENCN